MKASPQGLYQHDEEGVQGIALDPNFNENKPLVRASPSAAPHSITSVRSATCPSSSMTKCEWPSWSIATPSTRRISPKS
jgi:hypothetical protein